MDFGSNDNKGHKKGIIIPFPKNVSDNVKNYNKRITSILTKESENFHKNVRDLQDNIKDICSALNKRIASIRGESNYKMYETTAQLEIKQNYPHFEHIATSKNEVLIIEVIKLIWGWLLQCHINKEDIVKCQDALSAIISAHSLSDTQIALLKRYFAAKTASDLMDKYFPFTNQEI